MSIKQEAYQTTIKGSDTDYRFYSNFNRLQRYNKQCGRTTDYTDMTSDLVESQIPTKKQKVC